MIQSGHSYAHDIFVMLTMTKHKPHIFVAQKHYRQTSNMSHTLVGCIIVDHSDVVGASPVGAAPTTSSFST